MRNDGQDVTFLPFAAPDSTNRHGFTPVVVLPTAYLAALWRDDINLEACLPKKPKWVHQLALLKTIGSENGDSFDVGHDALLSYPERHCEGCSVKGR